MPKLNNPTHSLKVPRGVASLIDTGLEMAEFSVLGLFGCEIDENDEMYVVLLGTMPDLEKWWTKFWDHDAAWNQGIDPPHYEEL